MDPKKNIELIEIGLDSDSKLALKWRRNGLYMDSLVTDYIAPTIAPKSNKLAYLSTNLIYLDMNAYLIWSGALSKTANDLWVSMVYAETIEIQS